MERPLVAALRAYNPRAVSLVQIGVSKMMSPSEGERVTRGRCESSA